MYIFNCFNIFLYKPILMEYITIRCLLRHIYICIIFYVDALCRNFNALRYKPACLGFDSHWCHCNFSEKY